jgi:hypothetical protein
MSYVSEFKNTISIADTLLNPERFEQPDYFSSTVSPKIRTGIRQQISVATSFNVLQYFTLTPAMTFNSITQFKTIHKTWDPDSETVITDTINGARASFDFITSLSLSTKMYGFYHFERTKFSTVRHVITPTVTMSYMPDFTDPRYGFWEEVQSNPQGAVSPYSIFEGGIFGSSPAGKVGALSMNLMNSWEGKLRNTEDSVTSNVERRMLIDALNFNASYNFFAEHFNWSNLTASMRMKLFRLFDLNTSITGDPYMVSPTGVRIERFEIKNNNRLARLTNATFSLGTSLRPGGFGASETRNSGRGTQAEVDMINANPNAYVDFNVPWTLNMQYNLAWNKNGINETVTQTIRVAGDLNVTPKWKVGFDSNYDFTRKEFSYTSLNVYRDLHCWELQFNWIPFGFRQSYNVTINVKSAVLQDLKLTRKRDWYDFNQ